MTVRIINADCIDALRAMPEASVHCIITSPPYWGLRSYLPDDHPNKHKELGLEKLHDCLGWATGNKCGVCHVCRLTTVFHEVRRVLRDDGTLWINYGDCYATGGGKVGDCPGGGEQGARWRGDVDRVRDDKRGYRGDRLANGRGDQPGILRKKTGYRGDNTSAPGKHGYRVASSDGGMRRPMGPQTQPNRMPLPGLKPKDLVGMPWRIAFALQADGWYLRNDNIWHKPNPMPESVRDRCTKSHEYFFMFSKSEHYYFDQKAILEPVSENTHARLSQDIQNQVGSARANGGTRADRPMKAVARNVGIGSKARPRKAAPNGSGTKNNTSFDEAMAIMPQLRNKRSVWTVPTFGYSEAHFATFPPALIEPAIKAGCPVGGTVLDVFGGSATTGLVAERLGRNAILIELFEDYGAMGQKRICDEAPLFAHDIVLETGITAPGKVAATTTGER